jgi:hypothetical protein
VSSLLCGLIARRERSREERVDRQSKRLRALEAAEEDAS